MVRFTPADESFTIDVPEEWVDTTSAFISDLAESDITAQASWEWGRESDTEYLMGTVTILSLPAQLTDREAEAEQFFTVLPSVYQEQSTDIERRDDFITDSGQVFERADVVVFGDGFTITDVHLVTVVDGEDYVIRISIFTVSTDGAAEIDDVLGYLKSLSFP